MRVNGTAVLAAGVLSGAATTAAGAFDNSHQTKISNVIGGTGVAALLLGIAGASALAGRGRTAAAENVLGATIGYLGGAAFGLAITS